MALEQAKPIVSPSRRLPLMADVWPHTPQEAVEACAKEGIELYCMRGISLEEGSISVLEERMKRVREAAPGCRFMLEINCDAPSAWLQAHPDQRACTEEGPLEAASWNSEWQQQEAATAVRRLVRGVKKQGCEAVLLTAGRQRAWGARDDERMADVGPCMATALQLLMREKYRRNILLLRQALSSPNQDFHTVHCPAKAERSLGTHGVFRNPARSALALCWQEAVCSSMNRALAHCARAACEGLEGRGTVGAVYAPLFAGTAMHAGLAEEILETEALSFFAGAEEGTPGMVRLCTLSIRLRGKTMWHREKAGSPEAARTALEAQCGLILPAETPAAVWRSARSMLQNAPSSPPAARVCVLLDPAAPHVLAETEQASLLLNQCLPAQFAALVRTGTAFETGIPADLFHKNYPKRPLTIAATLYYLSTAERRQLDARLKQGKQTVLWLWGCGAVAEDGVKAENVARLTGIKTRMDFGAASLQARPVSGPNPLARSMNQGVEGSSLMMAPILSYNDREAVSLAAGGKGRSAIALKKTQVWTSVASACMPLESAFLTALANQAQQEGGGEPRKRSAQGAE